MRTGVFMESHLCRLFPCVLYLLIHLNQAAPGAPGTQREESADVRPPSGALANPFGLGEEDRRLLQSYIQSSLKDDEGAPGISTWEQELFFLFRIHDYDRSGLLDGLEMMKLLSDFNSFHTPGVQTGEHVVSMVDLLLQTQDVNQDGLLAPSELRSPSSPHTQDTSDNIAPQQQQQEMEKLSNPNTDEEKAGAAEQREEVQPHVEQQREAKTGEEEIIHLAVDKPHGQQIPEAPAAAAHEQEHKVPVHQGQPDM